MPGIWFWVVATTTFAIAAALIWLAADRSAMRRRLKKNESYRIRQDATYAQAGKKLDELSRKISKQLKGAMIVDLVHDFSNFPFPVERENTPLAINFEQAFEIMNKVRSADKAGPIAVILHTFGGYSLATEFIASALRHHAGNVVAYVPYAAMSGGTIAALACEEIKLGSNAALGPIETQYDGYPFSAYQKLMQLKQMDASDVAALNYFQAELREQGRNARLSSLARPHFQGAIPKLLDPTLPHDLRITAQDAPNFGLKVSTDHFPGEIYEYVETRLIMLRRYKELIIQPMQDELRIRAPREGANARIAYR